MNKLTTVLQHMRQTPITLCLSALALAFYAMPELGSRAEFHFADHYWLGSPTPLEKPLHMWQSLSWWNNCLRVAGCNWLHWSTDHLFWDVAMFYGLGSVCERRHRGLYLLTTVLAALTIPIAVSVTSPDLQSYRGLSGIDTALFALLAVGLVIDQAQQRNWGRGLFFGGLLMAMMLKIGYELHSQDTVFVSCVSFTPVPLAHLLGAAIGTIIAGLSILLPTGADLLDIRQNRRGCVGPVAWPANESSIRSCCSIASYRETSDEPGKLRAKLGTVDSSCDKRNATSVGNER